MNVLAWKTLNDSGTGERRNAVLKPGRSRAVPCGADGGQLQGAAAIVSWRKAAGLGFVAEHLHGISHRDTKT